MLKFITLLFISFVWSFFDSFLPFIPPVTSGVSSFVLILDENLIQIILLGIAIGLGATISLWFYRKIVYKFENTLNKKRIKKWRKRIAKLVDLLGYRVIIIFFATSLGAMVGYAYLISEKVNYLKYFIYATIGRTVLLFTFCAMVISVQTRTYLPLYIAIFIYAMLVVYTLILFLYEFKEIKKIFKG